MRGTGYMIMTNCATYSIRQAFDGTLMAPEAMFTDTSLEQLADRIFYMQIPSG